MSQNASKSLRAFELRPVRDEDHEFLVELHNDPLVLRNITHPRPITIEQHIKWWESIRNRLSEQRLVFTIDGHSAGFAKFYEIDVVNANCVLGADIHKDFRGRGFGKELWRLMLAKAFDEYVLHRVSLTTAEYNDVGRRLYANMGFIEEGRLYQSLKRDGIYYDQISMYQLRKWWEARRDS